MVKHTERKVERKEVVRHRKKKICIDAVNRLGATHVPQTEREVNLKSISLNVATNIYLCTCIRIRTVQGFEERRTEKNRIEKKAQAHIHIYVCIRVLNFSDVRVRLRIRECVVSHRVRVRGEIK